MVELGLNSHHQAEVLSYMKFARYLRGQSKIAIEGDFLSSKSSLFEDTYTQDEVRKILDDVEAIVTNDAEAEFCSFTHNNVLMLQQLFSQAENWHLRLEVQLSELQNRDLLEMIRQLEVDESVLKPAKDDANGENAVALLRMEIDRIRNENERIQEEQRECVDKLEQTQEELKTATKKLQEASRQIEQFSENINEKEDPVDQARVAAEMSDKLRNVHQLLQVDQESSRQRQATLINELNSTKEMVAQVRSQLKLAELELERKFSDTKAYANMKQILISKNTIIKQLRTKLHDLGATATSGDENE